MEGYLSEIRMFGGNFAPNYWQFCNGVTMSIAQYTALFSLIGTTYGGDGVNTFVLPDLRGRVAVGTGAAPGLQPVDIGEVAGTESVTLTSNNLPAHNHMVTIAVPGSEDDANTAQGNGMVLATAAVSVYSTGNGVSMGSINVPLQPTGGNASFPTIQPYLAINYIICIEGMYPTRS